MSRVDLPAPVVPTMRFSWLRSCWVWWSMACMASLTLLMRLWWGLLVCAVLEVVVVVVLVVVVVAVVVVVVVVVDCAERGRAVCSRVAMAGGMVEKLLVCACCFFWKKVWICFCFSLARCCSGRSCQGVLWLAL